MNYIRILFLSFICITLYNCGKVGPLNLPEEKLDKSILTYPCDDVCKEKFEEEKKRQQTVTLQTD
tara:strand:+ start:1180 stop:1374 length:195 start_codon:yes stop_codon:yes gene_type:complete